MAQETGAPEKDLETKVTPEMIEAGRKELCSRYLELQEGTDQFAALVEILFVKMWEARPKSM